MATEKKMARRAGKPRPKPAPRVVLHASDKLIDAVLGCVPNNWLDSLLTGPDGIKIPAGCPDVQRVLDGVRARLAEVLRKDRERLLRRRASAAEGK